MAQLFTNSGERNEREKTTHEEGRKIRSYSKFEKKNKRHLNNYALLIIIISLYDLFDLIGSFTNISSISRLIFYANDIWGLSGGFCQQNGRTKLLNSSAGKQKVILNTSPGLNLIQ